jgi:general secretion pathway protein K
VTRSHEANPVPRRDAGAVLVAVLWLLGLLGAVTLAMAVYTTNTLSAVDVYGDRVRADAAIVAGVELAAVQTFGRDPPQEGSSSAAIGEARVIFDYRSETARIDVNFASPELLAGLFMSLGARNNDAGAYAERIVQMREPTPVAASNAGAAGQGGGPPRKRFVDVALLDLVPGIPEGLAARAKTFLTVHSGVAGVNPLIAAPEVLAALPGMTRERVRTLEGLRGRGPIDPQALADALGEAQQYTVNTPGTATRIRVKAILGDGFTSTSEIVILHYDDDDEPYRILSWEDDVDMRASAAKASEAKASGAFAP